MFKLFDKTFFKFLSGFAVILAVSFGLLFAVGLYETKINNTASAIESFR